MSRPRAVVATPATAVASAGLNKVATFAITVASLALLSGCASWSGTGAKQNILIRSSPPGATILLHGKRIGNTPSYVEIKRGTSVDVRLKTDSDVVPVPLSSKYRWGRSFFGNLVLLTYAPIGWVWDLVTGAAWEVSDGPLMKVSLTGIDRIQSAKARELKTAAIAPPLASSLELSDAGAKELEAKLMASEPTLKLQPFSKTLPIFTRNDYDFDSPDAEAFKVAQSQLKVDLIYESKVVPHDQGWLLKSEAVDVFTSERAPGPVVKLESDQAVDRVMAGPNWWSRLAPNTIGLDFVTDRLVLTHALGDYELKPVDNDAWWSQGIRYIGALNISNVPARRRDHVSRWDFSAVPSFRISHRRVKAADLPPPPDNTFVESEPELERWLLAGGYGGEVSYQTGRHLFYLDLVPMFYWSEIKRETMTSVRSFTATGTNTEVELGYLLFIDSNWLVRVFSRSFSENSELWQEALSDRFAGSAGVISAARLSTGVSIGYRFEPKLRAARH